MLGDRVLPKEESAMSIASIAEESALRLAPGVTNREAIARRSAEAAVAAVKGGSTEDEAATKGTDAGKGAPGQETTGSVSSNILAQLVKYVPTEAITIYVAV